MAAFLFRSMRASSSWAIGFFTVLTIFICIAPDAFGQVKCYQKISDTQGNFAGDLDYYEHFGVSAASLGDLDGDGITDIAVGAYHDGYSDPMHGALYVLFLNSDGTVKSHQKISYNIGGFTGELNHWNEFAHSLSCLGDLDGDNVADLAVGARLDDDGGENRGAVWILFLNEDGTVKDQQKISSLAGGFTGVLDDDDWFGNDVATLGDFNGDGVTDLAVSAPHDDDGGDDRGAVYLLLLNSDGTVKKHYKISDGAFGFSGELEDGDHLGWGVASLGDFDSNGTIDIAVGAKDDDDGGEDRGAVYIFFMSGGVVLTYRKISSTAGGFTCLLDDGDKFGSAVASVNDFDGDGIVDLAVGALLDDDGGENRGAVWLLLLNGDGTVKECRKISDTKGNFTGDLDDVDEFGLGVASLGDFDGDGIQDIVVGARKDDDGGYDHGAVYLLFLTPALEPIVAYLDVRPGSCPNPFNPKSIGILPAAIPGTAAFDVADIDPGTLLLEGVSPTWWDMGDVTTPVMDGEECECTSEGPDGFVDLKLKFQSRAIAETLGEVEHDDVVELTITGYLTDGTPFDASDCIVIRCGNLEQAPRDERQLLVELESNPSEPTQRISYYLPERAEVVISIYDVAGRLVERMSQGTKPDGPHTVEWDASGLASGMYFLQLRTGTSFVNKKVLLVR